MILRTAVDEDLKALMAWIKDKEACKLWAGPVVRFPLTLENLKQDMEERMFQFANVRLFVKTLPTYSSLFWSLYIGIYDLFVFWCLCFVI